MERDLYTGRLFERRSVAAILSVTAVAVLFLILQGRHFWCQAGDLSPWSWDIWSTHNSQHLIDPYSFTHILHGVLEFWLVGLVFGRLPLAWRLVIAVSVEACWEGLENSSVIIDRYRAATISLDYFGDSIANSLSDIFCCGLGFAVARRLRSVGSVVLFVVTETVLALTVRDSLLINIVMMLYPIEAIKKWQMGG